MSLEEFQNLGKTILGLNDSNQIPYGVGFQDVKEIIKLVENNEYKDENLDVTLGIVASIPIYLLENVNKIQKQDIDALIHCFIQNFEKFTNKLVIQHIYEAFTIVSHSTKSSLSIILEYIRSENNKNNILKMFLLLAYIDEISIQSAEDSTIFIHIIMDNFQYATLAQQTQLITQLCSFALSLENFECHRQLIDFIFGYIITMINNEPKFISDIVYTFSKILLSLEMTIPELKFYVPDCLTQYLNSLADLSLEDRLKVIPNLAISFTLMNPDIYKDLLTNIVSDFSQIENYLPDSHFADHINSSQFYEDQLAAIWDILRPLLDDSKLASSAAFFSAVFCDALSSLSENVPSFISSRLSTLLMFENTNKPMIILAFGLISDHIDPLMLEKEYISNIFAASQTSVEAFKATKKTLKVLMNHDKIDGSKIVEEIDNLGEFNLDFTKDIFSILEYLIFVSDKVAVTKASRLVLSYIQNENSPPIVKMHAIGLLPIFLKSECPDIFVNLVMIGVNKTFEIIQQEITPEIAPLLRFIACGFVNNKITDVETFILPLNQTFLDICVCEDEKSSIIAMESLSMICEKDKSLDFPIEIIMENLISFSVRRIVASINAFSHLIGYYNEGQDKMIFYQIIEVAVKNKEKEIIKAAFNYFIEVIIAYPNDFIPDIEKIIILTFIGRLPYYNSLPFYEYESDDVDIYDLIREMIQNKDEKIICFILKIFPITTDIEKIGSLIVESIKNDLIQRERFNELISMTLDLLKVNSDDIDIVTCLIDILDSLWTASDESLETTPILNTLFDVFNEIIEEENEFTPIPPFVLKLLPKSPPNSLDFDTVHSMLEFISQKEIEWDYPDLVRDLILIYNSNMHSNKFFYLDIALALTSFVTMSNDDLEELGFKQKLIKEAKECLKSLILDNEYVSSNVFDFFSGKPEEKAILNDIINE